MKLKFSQIAFWLLPFMLFFSCGAAAGSADDPLVTRGWVDQYIAGQLAPLQKRLEQADQQLKSVRSIKLWIGRNYLQMGERLKKLFIPKTAKRLCFGWGAPRFRLTGAL